MDDWRVNGRGNSILVSEYKTYSGVRPLFGARFGYGASLS